METNNNLTFAIIKALAFFDMYDYALAFDELYHYVGVKCDMKELRVALNAEKKYWSEKNGYYFLSGREMLVDGMREFTANAENKFRIAKMTASILKYLPGVRMMAVCNSLARGVAGEKSDIDFFIILKKGRIWTLRLMITLIVHLLGVRRHAQKITDRICLSFYVTDDHLDIYEFEDQDLDYFWLSTMKPLYDDGAYREFIGSNKWLYAVQPNFSLRRMKSFAWQGDSLPSAAFKKIFGLLLFSPLGTLFENIARKAQLVRIRSHKDSLYWQEGKQVVVSDSVLKFHEKDDREEYRQRLRDKIVKLLNG